MARNIHMKYTSFISAAVIGKFLLPIASVSSIAVLDSLKCKMQTCFRTLQYNIKWENVRNINSLKSTLPTIRRCCWWMDRYKIRTNEAMFIVWSIQNKVLCKVANNSSQTWKYLETYILKLDMNNFRTSLKKFSLGKLLN